MQTASLTLRAIRPLRSGRLTPLALSWFNFHLSMPQDVSVQPTNYYVYISTEPDWNTDVVSGACTGEEVSLSIGVDGVPFTLEPGNDFGEAISLPDNVGTCFYSEITVNSFLPGAVLVDAGDGIENFFVNMEHSFLGDLDIAFICPNGQAMTVSSYPGPGTNLGVPIFDDDPPEPGTGYDYYWSSEATLDTWANEVEGPDGSLPSGTYASESSWGTLDGCPLNGTWQLEICDFWALDNGFVFEWGIDFADTLYPVTQSFTPLFGLECDSTFWTSTNQGEHGVPSGQWNCPDVGVTMSTLAHADLHGACHQQFRLRVHARVHGRVRRVECVDFSARRHLRNPALRP